MRARRMLLLCVLGFVLVLTSCGGSRQNTVDRLTCRSQMSTLASQEVIYFAQHERYTASASELGMDLTCPECGESYTITADGDHYTIECPCGHGSIDDGIRSWTD